MERRAPVPQPSQEQLLPFLLTILASPPVVWLQVIHDASGYAFGFRLSRSLILLAQWLLDPLLNSALVTASAKEIMVTIPAKPVRPCGVVDARVVAVLEPA